MANFDKDDISIIRSSELFDGKWYLDSYPDVRALGMDPAEHYIWIGARLNRNPSEKFDGAAYLRENGDVAKAGLNPLVHYARWGRSEGRRLSDVPAPVSEKSWKVGKKAALRAAPTILLCAHEVHPYLFGGERSFLDVLNCLAQLRVNIYVSVPKDSNADYLEALLENSCGVYSFAYPLWRKNVKESEAIIESFADIIKRHQVDVVYVNTIFVVEPQIASKRLGRFSVCHARELIDQDDHLRNRIGLNATEIVSAISRRSDLVVANSKATQALFSGAVNVIHAPNVVSPAELDIPNDVGSTLTFAIVSSNTPKKGIADFLEVARICRQTTPNARFLVIGPTNAYTEELVQKGLPENLSLAGYASSPRAAMERANVVLSLSHFAESFGRTVAEAQAARRPVIAYDWGAIPELIEQGRTGFLAPYRDVDSVASYVEKLCSEPSLIKEMGEAGRAKMIGEYAPDVLRKALQRVFRQALQSDIGLRSDVSKKRVTVIVPVYNAPDSVRCCLESLRKWTDVAANRILMINDGSTHPDIGPLLHAFERDNEGFYLINNESNLGYTRTINKAIQWAEEDDVVLLNSDTLVTPEWLEGLQRCALERSDVGTVTAMSDNAGAFSFPISNEYNPKPDGVTHELWAATLLRATGTCRPVEVPTGNGFCIYIKRELIKRIGLFDEKAFPRGYGEENDFCMRALGAGWVNLISPYSFVFHERTKSFGKEKEELVKNAMEIMGRKHPTYAKRVRAAFSSSEMLHLRQAFKAVYDFDAKVSNVPVSVANDSTELPEQRFVRLNEALINWPEVEKRCASRQHDLVSIVICVYNNAHLTEKCLISIFGHTQETNFEVVVVDNGSDIATLAMLERWAKEQPKIKLIRNFENLNFSLGNNIGFAASQGSRVVFLNNDTEVTSGWLEALLNGLDVDGVKAAQPKLLFPDGRVQCIGVVFSAKSPLGYPIYADEPNNAIHTKNSRNYRAITAACLAIRAIDFAKVKGFDPHYINGQEDVDLCLRLGEGKAVFACAADSIVYHHEGRTPGRGKHIKHNRTLFVERWSSKFEADDVGYYRNDSVTPSEYSIDVPEFLEQGIACWRPSTYVQ